MGNLQNLVSLKLDGNKWTSLDAPMAWSSLVTLNASDNQLSAVGLGWLGNLVNLDLSTNQLTTVDLSEMGTPTLSVVDLSNNDLISVMGNTANWPQVPNITQLWLESNQLTALGDLSVLKALQYLNLGNNPSFNCPSLNLPSDGPVCRNSNCGNSATPDCGG